MCCATCVIVTLVLIFLCQITWIIANNLGLFDPHKADLGFEFYFINEPYNFGTFTCTISNEHLNVTFIITCTCIMLCLWNYLIWLTYFSDIFKMIDEEGEADSFVGQTPPHGHHNAPHGTPFSHFQHTPSGSDPFAHVGHNPLPSQSTPRMQTSVAPPIPPPSFASPSPAVPPTGMYLQGVNKGVIHYIHCFM